MLVLQKIPIRKISLDKMIGICNSQVSPLRTWVSRFFLRHLHLLTTTSLALLCSSFLSSVRPPFFPVILSFPLPHLDSWQNVMLTSLKLFDNSHLSSLSTVIFYKIVRQLYLLPIANVSCLLVSVLAPWYPHTLSFLLSICLTIG